jgi:hypothetical protein
MITRLLFQFTQHIRIRLALARIGQNQSHAVVTISPNGCVAVEAVDSLEIGKRLLEQYACYRDVDEAWIWERGG